MNKLGKETVMDQEDSVTRCLNDSNGQNILLRKLCSFIQESDSLYTPPGIGIQRGNEYQTMLRVKKNLSEKGKGFKRK